MYNGLFKCVRNTSYWPKDLKSMWTELTVQVGVCHLGDQSSFSILWRISDFVPLAELATKSVLIEIYPLAWRKEKHRLTNAFKFDLWPSKDGRWVTCLPPSLTAWASSLQPHDRRRLLIPLLLFICELVPTSPNGAWHITGACQPLINGGVHFCLIEGGKNLRAFWIHSNLEPDSFLFILFFTMMVNRERSYVSKAILGTRGTARGHLLFSRYRAALYLLHDSLKLSRPETESQSSHHI